jgi:hypothetical protein
VGVGVGVGVWVGSGRELSIFECGSGKRIRKVVSQTTDIILSLVHVTIKQETQRGEGEGDEEEVGEGEGDAGGGDGEEAKTAPPSAILCGCVQGTLEVLYLNPKP